MMLTQIRQRLEQEKGRLAQVRHDLASTRSNLQTAERQKLLIEQGQLVIQEVAQKTQSRLAFHISGMVGACIKAIFPEDQYEFKMEFVQRRGKTECDLFLADAAGNRIKPEDAEGGGLVNVAAFALRIALWSLSKPSRPVFVLDEPFHFLHSAEAHARVAEMLNELGQKLNLQIIMVTGEESEEIIKEADSVIEIKKIKGISNANKKCQ